MHTQSRNPLRHVLAVATVCVPLVYLATIWNGLPATIARHFDLHGRPDAYGTPADLLWLVVFMTMVSLISYITVVNVHRLDKKRMQGIKPPVFDNIAIGSVVFISILTLAIIINSINPDVVLLDKIMIPALGLFFIFMGNVMYNIKQNRFVGIRLPWTLNDEDNWKSTHRLGGKLFFAGGLLITFVALVSTVEVASMFLTAVGLLILIVTVGYSYSFHRNNLKNNA